MKGTIRERSPGVWEVRAPAPRDPVTGQRRQPSRTVHGNERKAKATLRALLSEIEGGGHQGTATTVAELLDAWLAHVADDYSPTTVREYRNFVRARLRPALGRHQLRRLDPPALDAYYRSLTREGGLAPATARKAHAIMHLALAQAVRWGWLAENVADDATPPRLGHAEVSPPTPETVLALLAAVQEAQPALGAFLRLTAASGARRGEVCGLRWADLDLDDGGVVFQRSVIELPGGEVVAKDTKTHRARVAALDEGTLWTLRKHRAVIDDRAAMAGVELERGGFIFSHCPAGCHPWRPNYVTRQFIRLRDRLGFVDLRLHDFRHFSATQLLAAGVDVKTVSARHGWANAQMPLNRYGHAMAAMDRRAAEIMGEILTPNAKNEPPPPEGDGGS